jgi:hypothetical protein
MRRKIKHKVIAGIALNFLILHTTPVLAGSGLVNLSNEAATTAGYWDSTTQAYVLQVIIEQGQEEKGLYASPVNTLGWGSKQKGARTLHFQSAGCRDGKNSDYGTNNGRNSGCVSIGKCISGFGPNESDVGACIGIVAAHEATEVWNGIDKCDKYESHVWIVNGAALADCTLPAKNAKATGFLDEAHQVSKAGGDTEVEDADDDKPMQPEPDDGIDRLPTNLAGALTRLTRLNP